MSKLSTEILINKIKLMDKIDCEIESAREWKNKIPSMISVEHWNRFDGKIDALQDLKQWIEDLE